MRTLTRERITLDPHRTLVHTPDTETPGAVLLDQTGARPVPVTALNALDAPDTAFAVPSPYRPGVLLLGATNSDRDQYSLTPTFTVGGLVEAGPCVIVAYNGRDTVALTLDEIFYVLRNVYVSSTYPTPEQYVLWLVDLSSEAE